MTLAILEGDMQARSPVVDRFNLGDLVRRPHEGAIDFMLFRPDDLEADLPGCDIEIAGIASHSHAMPNHQTHSWR